MSLESTVAKSHGLHLRAVRSATREADFVASTAAIDSYDEIVEQSWRLDRFRSNPVVLFAHQSRELPIGRATRVAVVGGQLEATIQFATAEMNPKADQVFKMVEAKILNAVSVGFVPNTVRRELRDGREIYVLADNELHEISVVPIPANPEALAKMKSKARADAELQAQGIEAMHPSTGVAAAWATPITGLNAVGQSTVPLTIGVLDVGSTLSASTGVINIKSDGSISLRTPNNPPASLSGPPTNNETKEPPMKTIEELTAALAKSEANLEIAHKSLGDAQKTAASEKMLLETTIKTLETEKAALSKEHEKACTDRDTATKRADEAEAKLIELEVDALIGKKITPAEKDDFVALRKSSPSLFKSMVEKRQDLKLTEVVVPKDKTNGSPSTAVDLLNEVKKSAGL